MPGALPSNSGTTFSVWAPNAERVELVLEAGGVSREMEAAGDGYFELHVADVAEGAMYRYRLDGGPAFPDPASRFQPEGVHGPSMVVDASAFEWKDEDWAGISRRDLVFYELHVGTFSPEGTFDGVRAKLPYLRDLGITAVELMPVADFPGRWNWGYDHAALFAPSRAYGRPDDLRALVDEAHRLGLAVFLDVIYNHLGPDGAYVAAFAPMFTDKHHTPWGSAINLDDERSEGVRAFFIENALHWLREYHIDGLCLDATHALVDDSPVHFLAELAAAVGALEQGPRRIVIAEDSRNINTLILPPALGGYGLDGVWTDDFHHQVRNMTAGDEEGYYQDFTGTTADDLAVTIEQGWYYDGRPSRHLGRPRGTDASVIDCNQCVICIQNHDQVGNRPLGNRLSDDVSPAQYRAASALLLFAPELPLLFMGQEWAATTPFQFFTDHEPELGRLVTEGRKEEFKHFAGFSGEVPDPQDPETFSRSRLRWEERTEAPHAGTLALYRDLLRLRRELPPEVKTVAVGEAALVVRRGPYVLLVALADGLELPLPEGAETILTSEDTAYAPDGIPPEVVGAHVRFARAGALAARAS